LKSVKFQEDAKYLACAKDLTILSMAGRYKQPVQYGTGGEFAHKSWALESHSSLGDYISQEENVLIRVTREKPAVTDSAEPKQ
jgi:hypothetical protein